MSAYNQTRLYMWPDLIHEQHVWLKMTAHCHIRSEKFKRVLASLVMFGPCLVTFDQNWAKLLGTFFVRHPNTKPQIVV